ncbi:MAG: mandelate racemase/muconate lactonizing enzyme family protein [Streptosporangiaceae bacterium]
MKICRLDTHVVQAEISRPFSASIARGRHSHRGAILVRVVTDDGLEGWGETFQALASPPDALAAVIRDLVAPRVIGRSPLECEAVYREVTGAGRGYGRLAARALAAVDTALWDVKGKALGQPIAALLGAAESDTSFPAVATAVFYGEPVESVGGRLETVARLLEQGFTAVKVKIGGTRPDIDLEHVAAIRRMLPDDVMLCVDANSGLTPTTAVDVGRRLQDHGVYWLEEPIDVRDTAVYRRLAAATSLVLAGGQDVADISELLPTLRESALHLVQPSIAGAGGITGVWKLIQQAAALGARYCPTGWGSGLLISASLHLRAATVTWPTLPLPDKDWIEYDVSDNPLRDVLLTEPPRLSAGHLTLSTGPGLGVTVDTDALARLTIASSTVTP